MPEPSIIVDEGLLARFVPMSALGEAHLRELAHHARLVTLAPGDALDEALGRVDAIHYLIDGAVSLSGGGQPEEIVRARDPEARFALPAAQAEGRRARALEPTQLLRVERAKVSTLLIWAEAAQTDPGERDSARLQRDITALLLQSHLFARIPPSNIERIGELIEPVHLRAGETVIRQGERGDHYYIIERGRCEVLRDAGDGSAPMRLAELGAGDSFGEEALLTDSERNASVRMLSDGTVLRLTRAYFIDLISSPLVQEVSHERAEDLVATGAHWMDVRLPEEFERDGLPEAINIPLGALRARTAELPAGASYVTYCNSGRRAQAGAFLLSQRGFHACCLRDGIAHRRPSRTDGAAEDESLPALHAALVRVNAELDQALERKARADAAHAVQTSLIEPSEAQADAQARLAGLTEQARLAGEALRAAMAAKRTLESRIRDAEAEAVIRRRAAETQCENLRAQAKERLEIEKQRLTEHYRQASERLREIEQARQQAEARFDVERERIVREQEQARARLEAEAAQVRASIEAARQQAQNEAENIRNEHMSEERRLRRETEEALREERRRLEEDFSLSIAVQEQARHELDQVETARVQAEQATATLSEAVQAQFEAQRQAEAEQREAQVRKLREESATARARLEDATRAHELARQRQKDYSATLVDAARAGDAEREAQVRGELASAEQTLARTDDALTQAREAHASAAQAETIAAQTTAAARSRADELRLQLYEEMEGWISEEEDRSREELQNAERYARELARIQAEKEARRTAEAQATAGMLSDIEGMLSGTLGNDPLDSIMRTHMIAEEKARLVQRARRIVAEQTERARAAVKRGEDGEPAG
jgi:rhodanese-related sulfurtransferase